jgi:hypothetical protein
MTGSDHSAAEDLEDRAVPTDQLAASARGWHAKQLAVLGFIGFCGILWDGDAIRGSAVLPWLVAALATLGFALAMLATFLVARVAYPIGDSEPAGRAPGEAAVQEQTRSLVTGIRMTYVAMALVVAATLSGWAPAPPEEGAVVVGDAAGQTWCGELLPAPVGEARVLTPDGPVSVSLDRVVLLHPVADC